MKKSEDKISNDLIGAAGVHFVVSQLSLRGIVALPTIRNTGGIDILVNDVKNNRFAALQVKTSLKKVNFWPTARPEKCLKGKNYFYVFLRFDKEQEQFEAFLDNADKVVHQINMNLKYYREKGKKEFPYWGLPDSENGIEKLRQNWKNWRPL